MLLTINYINVNKSESLNHLIQKKVERISKLLTDKDHLQWVIRKEKNHLFKINLVLKDRYLERYFSEESDEAAKTIDPLIAKVKNTIAKNKMRNIRK